MKRIISAVLSLLMLLSVAPQVLADEPAEEAINYAVTLLSERLYYKKTIDCYPLDISSACNMGYVDEVSGDGVGGWSDQGPTNDLASFNLRGNVYLYNVPFNFIEPAANNGKSVIMLRGQNNENFPLVAEIPVNDTAEGMYILHGAAWGSTKGVGKYGFVYEDGTSAMFEIICGTHLSDYWGTKENAYMRTAWTGSNPSSSVISLNIFALNNPHPEKKIKNVKFLAYGDTTYMGIVGVTMARSGFCFPLNSSTSQNTLKAASEGIWPSTAVASEESFEGTILDSSKYLDAPAGKHGLLSTKGEDLYFADGTKAKLWGTNIAGEACYPEKEDAESMASRIARCGYNLVRFVNMDQKELTDERLDKLAYFQSLLREKGIYTYFSLLGNAPGDGADIPDGWKIEGLFDDELIEKQQEFADTLLNFKNKYTNTTFAKDPSLVMIDLADQNTMFDYKLGDSDLALISEESKQLINKKFNEFLKNKYKSTKALKKSWSVVYDDEKIEDGTMKINGNWKYGLFYDDAHRKDVYEFFAYLQKQHFDALSKIIRNSGYRGLISGVTNMWNNFTPYNSYSQSKYADFLPVNGIGSNAFASNLLKNGLWNADYDSIIGGDTHDGNEFLEFAENRVSGTAYVISEWGTGVISPTPYEAPILMSVLASQQNWTPIQYCFVYDKINNDKYEDLYSTYSNPVALSLAQLSAALYYNTDELDDESTYNYNDSYLYTDKNLNNGATTNIHKRDLYPTFKNYFSKKTNVTFKSEKTDLVNADSNKYTTVNDNMYFDMIEGRMFVHNSKAVAYAGNVSHAERIGRLYFDLYSVNGYIGLISADDKDIDKSERMLLTIGGRTLNKNMDMNDSKIIDIGTAPIIYENIVADITIYNAAGYKVYPLDAAGQRMAELQSVSNSDGSLSFTVNDYPNAINYEIVKEG